MTLDKPNRINSIDLLKGIIMVVMALDHVRDYFHYSVQFFDPIDPAQSTLPIYLTRWITNYCAPAFCFLAGVSAWLSGRKKTRNELAVFLVKRGIWLILLELTVVIFAWQFDPFFRSNNVGVIAVLGFSMIVLAALIYIPPALMLTFCLVVICGHNLLDQVHIKGNIFWSLFHQDETYDYSWGRFYVIYPIIPWIAVMPLGYWFGRFYGQADPAKRRKVFTATGLAAIVLFLVLRGVNVYGDLYKWDQYDSSLRTVMSFLNVHKYPPSLLYLLITLGPVLVFLGNSERLKGPLVQFFVTLGKVPFFYYLIHLFVLHLLAVVVALIAGDGWQLLVLPDWIVGLPYFKGYGYSLPVVYLMWALVIAICYPLCKQYGKYKESHREKWWLSYL